MPKKDRCALTILIIFVTGNGSSKASFIVVLIELASWWPRSNVEDSSEDRIDAANPLTIVSNATTNPTDDGSDALSLGPPPPPLSSSSLLLAPCALRALAQTLSDDLV